MTFFNNVGNQIIEANFQGKSICFNPQTVLPERRALANLEFKNRDASAISDEEILEDRIKFLGMRLSLYSVQVPRPPQAHIRTERFATDDNLPDPFPVESVTGLQCPYFLGIEDYHPLVRQYEFARKDVLIDHFRTHEPGMDFSGGRTWDYPNCDIKLRSLEQYKFHQIQCTRSLFSWISDSISRKMRSYGTGFWHHCVWSAPFCSSCLICFKIAFIIPLNI